MLIIIIFFPTTHVNILLPIVIYYCIYYCILRQNSIVKGSRNDEVYCVYCALINPEKSS